jgi:polyisoprenyl-teichoic acid--peptidoglycan teichoic acid transferase
VTDGDVSLRRQKRMRRAAIAVIAVVVLCLIGAAASPVARALGHGRRVPVLLFGVDAADLSRHTDTLMLAVFDPSENYLGILNVPRDTRISLPGYRFHRVNEIYGYHLRRSNDRRLAAEKIREGVEYLLSSDDTRVPVPYHIGVDFSGFTRMVDLLGGVWVNVKIPMHYDDNAGNYHFHMEPGRYLLKGQDALRYVRFRGQTGDRGRIYRQQEFLRNMVKRLANPMMVFKVPRMAAVIATSVQTNLSVWDMLYLATAVRRVRSDNVGFYLLPGKPSGALWVPNRAMAADLAGAIVAGRPPAQAVDEIAPLSGTITVNVWNASGKTGLAYKVTRQLRQAGYDVVDWGNYAVEQLQTRVVDRRGRIGNARAVAETLGAENYHSEPNPKILVDVEVVLGQNFGGTFD